MPITNNASYLPTMDQFLAHWDQVNAQLADPLLVATSKGEQVSQAQFATLRSDLEGRNIQVIDDLNDQQIARGEIGLKRVGMLAMLNEFNDNIVAYWHNTGFLGARPKAPSLSDGQQRFIDPLEDVASLWEKVNAAPAPPGVTLPLTLSDGTTVAAFKTALAALKAAFLAEKNAAQDVTLSRKWRDETKAAAYDVMKNYRLAVEAKCRAYPALLESMPRLTPPEGGHTPEPVNASATFQEPDQAKVVYDASTDAMLDHYELRGNPGPQYDDEDAVVIATNAPEAVREFLTGFGLNQPGAEASYKVYVILTTGNEAGSAAMTVSRPLG